MSVTRMMTRSATVLREIEIGQKDRGGNALTDDLEEQVRCAFQQQRRTEHEDGAEISNTLWDLYLPYGTAIDTGDAVLVDGLRYEVVGEPWIAQEGSRSLWHVAATVQRTAGTAGSGS